MMSGDMSDSSDKLVATVQSARTMYGFGHGVDVGNDLANVNSATGMKLALANAKRKERSTRVLRFTPPIPRIQQPVESVSTAKVRFIGLVVSDRNTDNASASSENAIVSIAIGAFIIRSPWRRGLVVARNDHCRPSYLRCRGYRC